MGGGNAQKSAAARERNQKKLGKTDEERKAASQKAAKDAAGFVCGLCKMTFMINVKPATLLLHVTSKHPAGTEPVSCFPVLRDYDPNTPATAAAAAAPAVAVAPKPKKKVESGLDDLLNAGLSKGKKK